MSRNRTDHENTCESASGNGHDILQLAPIGVFTSTPEGRYIFVNPALARMFGYNSPKELMESITDITTQTYADPEDRRSARRLLERDGEVVNHECRRLRRDGSEFWVSMNVRAVRDEAGKVVQHQGFTTDISARKRAEQELRESEERSRLLSSLAKEGLVVHKDGMAIDMNAAVPRLLGCKREELLNQRLLDFVHPDDKELVRARLAEESTPPYEIRLIRKDGTSFPAEVEGHDFLQQGQTLRVTTVRDITERHRTARALRESEFRLQDLFESMPNGYYRSTPEGRFVDANPAYVRMLGYSSKEELLQVDIPRDVYVRPDERGVYLRANRNSEFLECDHFEYYRLRTKDGRIIHVEDQARYVTDAQGQVIFHEGICRDITERKLAEDALRESELRHRVIFANSPLGMIYFDSTGTIVECNDKFVELMGSSREKLIGFNTARQSTPRMREAIKTALAGTPSTFEDSYTSVTGGKSIMLRVVFNPVHSGSPNTEVIATLEDITERKQAEEALRESEERNRLLSDLTVEGIVVHRRGVVADLNSAMADMLRCQREELLAKNLLDFVHPEDLDTVLENLGKEQAPPYVVRMSRKGGAIFYAEIQAYNFQRQGETWRVAVIRDITERKQAEEALRESEERFKALHNASFGGIAIHDKGVILDCNLGLSEITGYSVEELIGMGGLQLMAERYRPESMEKVLAGYEKPYEVMGLRKNGEEYPLRLEARNIPYKGKLVRATEFRDITKTKRIQEALRQAKEQAETASRVKSQFLANMSHELRTPLNGILGMLQLMQGTGLTPEQKEYAALAIDSSKRLTHLLSDILDISRVEAGRMPILSEPFDLKETLLALKQLFLPSARQTRNRLSVHIDPAIPQFLLGDAFRLQQVVSNLVANALKFTRSGAITVEVSLLSPLTPGQSRVLFSVADTGQGIPEEKQSELFQPFSQIDSEMGRQSQGAGLGLHICRRLVALMGGSLSLESMAGAGTTVHFCVPFVQTDPPAETALCTAKEEAAEAGSPWRILLAEDSLVNQLAVRRFLEKQGHKVRAVDNGLEALSALKNEDFDAVLMDIQMPIMGGIEATQAIRSGEAGAGKARIPIVALTAYAMAGDRERFLEAGMDDYLAKPVDMKDLRNLLLRMSKVC